MAEYVVVEAGGVPWLGGGPLANRPAAGIYGRMYASDEPALYKDNGSAWVSANPTETAQSILDKLKTVDGAGSGLDADLLDGLSSADYTRSNDARLSDARTPTAHDHPPEAWIEPTLLNGWTNFGSSWATAGYYKDQTGMVVLKGMVAPGTLGAAVFTLPAGYRPAQDMIFAGVGNAAAYVRVDVLASGAVSIVQGGSAWTTLNNIRFRAEQ